jgi:multiple sugar transport system permease protein
MSVVPAEINLDLAEMRRRRRRGWWRRERSYVVALTPATLLLTLFFVVPAAWAVYASLTNLSLLNSSVRNPEFIGFDNYRRLWNDPDFPMYVKNTVVFVTGSAIIGQTVLGLALALLFHQAALQGYRLAGIAFTALMAAWISPPLLTGFIWGRLFDSRGGVLNALLDDVGLGPVDFLGRHAMSSVITVEIWRGTAFATIIFIGALQTIPRQIYEAARCDGTNALGRFWHHTLPMLHPVLALVLTMTTINAAGSFLMIFVLTNGDPGRQTETISLFAYHRAFEYFEIAFGAAITVVMLAVNVIFAIVYLGMARARR